ncbi:PAP/OAS1 substrate-binding domain-containing protein [Polyplosphaeria fusca]|uniref:polynucleotide adenylyltransferase n=1 Tax=Polyplosphaeria fusca TaxID=682080 RepID=A0A9P4UX64_9PLEO|nr:PAP/OAS1 substrate-binding domain-containing protein [Polyplosphaeria fusca]
MDGQKSSGLEEELRQMILGNVKISNHDTDPQSSARGPHQHQHHRHGQNWNRRSFHQDAQSTGMNTHRGRGRGGPSHRANRGRQAPVHTNALSHPPQLPPAGHVAQTEPHAARQNRPQQHHQWNTHLMAPQNGQMPQSPTSTNQPPRVLQRPHNPTVFHAQPLYRNQQPEDSVAQFRYLDSVVEEEVPKIRISLAEYEEKEAFRKSLEQICQNAINEDYSGDLLGVRLEAFGSVASGFATAVSDMDLAIIPIWKDQACDLDIEAGKHVPRLLEKVLLEANMGARLLTRTRVPILKVCQTPTEPLYEALSEERRQWDDLPEEEKYPAPAQVIVTQPPSLTKPSTGLDEKKSEKPTQPKLEAVPDASNPEANTGTSKKLNHNRPTPADSNQIEPRTTSAPPQDSIENPREERKPRHDRPWRREKVLGPLDFPKTGVGVQCDINFGNPLGIHNTRLLRCYSCCDPRVREMVLFIKAWAKRRKINSSYSGTLSSYGWVLMVLHYLCNIASPPVCPNLQLSWRPPKDLQGLEDMFQKTIIKGYPVRFWDNEQEILALAQAGRITLNRETLGQLLRGFFQYFAGPSPYGPRPPIFNWATDILSLRTLGGIRFKKEKGWTGAKTTIAGGKEVRNRYLFAIEDPFELDHNVARTVTHNGIVAIRDEFRRAGRILGAIGRGQQPEGSLFDELVEQLELPITPVQVTMESASEVGLASDEKEKVHGAEQQEPVSHVVETPHAFPS